MQMPTVITRSVLCLTLLGCVSGTALAGESGSKLAVKPVSAGATPVGPPSPGQGLSGSWQGELLAPGISRFETIRSTITFWADGNFVLAVEKSGGTLRRTGIYSLSDGVLALSFAFGASAPERYKLARGADTLSLQALGNTTPEPMKLQLVKPAATSTDKPTPKAP